MPYEGWSAPDKNYSAASEWQRHIPEPGLHNRQRSAVIGGAKLALALLAGGTLGAATIQGIQARGKPLAYDVIDVADMTDPSLYRTLIAKVLDAISAFKGRYVMGTEKITSLDGIAPQRFVVIAFDGVETAKAWSNSAAQKEIDSIRTQSSKSRSFIVEGM